MFDDIKELHKKVGMPLAFSPVLTRALPEFSLLTPLLLQLHRRETFAASRSENGLACGLPNTQCVVTP